MAEITIVDLVWDDFNEAHIWERQMSDKMSYKGPEYPTKAHGSIPSFNSYEEEANFWDTHDFTEFQQETTPVTVRSTRRTLNNNAEQKLHYPR